MKRLLPILVFIFCANQLMGQYVEEENPTEKKDPSPYDKEIHHALGFVAGTTSGLGLGYRFYYNDLGVQVCFLPLKNETTERYWAGLSFIYSIVNGNSANLLVMQSNSYYSFLEYALYDGQGNVVQDANQASYFNHGIGLGIETAGDGPLRLMVVGGYGAYKDFEEINFSLDAGIFFHF